MGRFLTCTPSVMYTVPDVLVLAPAIVNGWEIFGWYSFDCASAFKVERTSNEIISVFMAVLSTIDVKIVPNLGEPLGLFA